MKTLIVDDEPLARRVLREELELLPGVEIAGEAQDGASALDAVRTLRPQVVLLDLQMPDMTGFDVIRRLSENAAPLPVIIVVTAYDQHAIRAFEAGALDYLLKPVSAERVATAMDRARRLLGRPERVAEQSARWSDAAGGASTPRKIVGRLGEEYFLLDPDEVLAFQAEDDVVWILTVKRKYQATLTLRALEERLRGLSFQRVHRSALVNVKHVRKMAPLSSSRWLLTLQNSTEFVVSKRQAQTVRDLLS